MPLPAAVAAAYAAAAATAATASSALPSAAPFAGAALIGLGIVATHEPGKLDMANLQGKPEIAAECLKRNVSAMNVRLVAAIQPLQGTETMGVTIKRGVVGDPVMNVILQEAGAGSAAEFRPLTPPEQQPDIIQKMIAGC